MPRSFKVTKPIDVAKGQAEGPNKLRFQLAAKRKLAKNIQTVGRRKNSEVESDF